MIWSSQGVMAKRERTMVRPLTEKHYYLNFAETSQPKGRETGSLSCMPRRNSGEQAVGSLGPLGCTCYQACARGLATRWSAWDLHHFLQSDGNTHLGGGFALRCCQRFSFLDVAIQLWPGQANWLTSGPAISVLSY